MNLSLFIKRWQNCGRKRESTLLRLVILRDMTRAIHTERSRLLAKGKKTKADFLQKLELDLDKKLQDLENQKYDRQELPEIFVEIIMKHRFARPDRKWERKIALEAFSQRWTFWMMECWVEPSKLEKWDQKLFDNLWPKGFILFTESVQPSPLSYPGESLWQGRWYLILHPKLTLPSKTLKTLQRWPGTPKNPPAPPHWTRIYPER